MSLPDTFWAKAKTTDCIVWTGAQNNTGYGCFGINGKSQLAHRLVWEEAHGPIPDGMTIDHLCRVHSCIRLDHLELVTMAENIRRRPMRLELGSECKRGHILTAENIYVNAKGNNECIECRVQLRREQRQKDRQIAVALGGAAAMRAWAINQGFQIGAKGRIPRNIRDAYIAAHAEAAA
jgi:hypothetical protein